MKALSRIEAEKLAGIYGCKITYHRAANASLFSNAQDTYIECGNAREHVGRSYGASRAVFFCGWTTADWIKAFERVSGKKTANLWAQERQQ